MAPRYHEPAKAIAATRLRFNADVAAIAIAIALATLIRLNVIHHIGW